MTTETNNNATQNTASTPTQTGAANPGSTEAKLFTQADVDRILNEKLEKAPQREARIKAELLKQLGLAEDADFNTLKSTIEEARKRKEADMSEADKARAELERERKAREAAEQKALTIEAERRNDRIASALTSAAGKLKANDTDDVLRYARDKHAEALTALIDDSGEIDQKKVDTLMDKIKAEKAHYFTPPVQPFGSPSNSGGRMPLSDARLREQGAQDTKRHIKANF